ncbi:MAG: hypothetical protein PHQ18_00605 [Patescibacteria group bacterium]|nr:hypothetical protein [Patescibacteria group bacterium]
MAPDNKKNSLEEKNFKPNFLNNTQESQNNISSQETQPDYVGFQPETTKTEINEQIPEQKNIEQAKQNPETHVEIEQNLDTRIQTLKKKLKQSKKKNTQIPIVKDEMTLRIEKVMEDGLEDAYKELTPLQQQEFKIKGEQTAWKIRQVLKKTHVKIKEVFKLLFEWLRLLPGVNKFFLEQEAKIKADKIISIKKINNN